MELQVSSTIWEFIRGVSWGSMNVSSLSDTIAFIARANSRKRERQFAQSVMAYRLWEAWKVHNKVVFQQLDKTPMVMACRALAQARDKWAMIHCDELGLPTN